MWWCNQNPYCGPKRFFQHLSNVESRREIVPLFDILYQPTIPSHLFSIIPLHQGSFPLDILTPSLSPSYSKDAMMFIWIRKIMFWVTRVRIIRSRRQLSLKHYRYSSYFKDEHFEFRKSNININTHFFQLSWMMTLWSSPFQTAFLILLVTNSIHLYKNHQMQLLITLGQTSAPFRSHL